MMRRFLILAVGLSVLLLSLSYAGPLGIYENVCFENVTIGTNPYEGRGMTLRLASGSGVVRFENDVFLGGSLGLGRKLGIGVTSPSEALEIAGNLKMSAPSSMIYVPPPVQWTMGAFTFQWDEVRVRDNLIVQGPLLLQNLPGISDNYAKIGGLLIQWGKFQSGRTAEGTTGTVNFPVSYPSGVKPVVILAPDNPDADTQDFWLQAYNVTNSSFQVREQADKSNPAVSTWNIWIYWIAIGFST
jgi:hypothetical protein